MAEQELDGGQLILQKKKENKNKLGRTRDKNDALLTWLCGKENCSRDMTKDSHTPPPPLPRNLLSV